MKNRKIIGWKDYYDVGGNFGERQGRSHIIVEEEFHDDEESCHSIKEGIRWIKELLNEYRESFDLVFLKGAVQHIKVPLIEDKNGEPEEDWYGDIQYLDSKEFEWHDNDDDDDDDDE